MVLHIPSAIQISIPFLILDVILSTVVSYISGPREASLSTLLSFLRDFLREPGSRAQCSVCCFRTFNRAPLHFLFHYLAKDKTKFKVFELEKFSSPRWKHLVLKKHTDSAVPWQAIWAYVRSRGLCESLRELKND